MLNNRRRMESAGAGGGSPGQAAGDGEGGDAVAAAGERAGPRREPEPWSSEGDGCAAQVSERVAYPACEDEPGRLVPAAG
jgi:hypothetical protein